MREADRIREVLQQISELAESVKGGDGPLTAEHVPPAAIRGCTLQVLPTRLLREAARFAQRVNPVNAPVPGPLATAGIDIPLDPMRIAVLTSKYWGPSGRRLTVSFMGATPAALRTRIISHLNAWSASAGISFVETNQSGDVRISREAGGYWSYLGTDIKLVPDHLPTMNLEAFTMSTPESEYRRVIRHEAGHTLGFPHEHMRRELVARIDREKAYAHFLETQGWDADTVDRQVLTPLEESSIWGTTADENSIMCYQLPGSITLDGNPILGGHDINMTDYAFAAMVYPKVGFEREGLRMGRMETPAKEKELPLAALRPRTPDWGEAYDPKPAA